MNIGTIAVVIASAPNMLEAYRNRDSIKGYSNLGAALMCIATAAFFCAFWEMENYISMAAQIPPFAFWLAVFAFTINKESD